MNHWTKSPNSGYAIDIIYFDFKKAFDSVPHHRLLHKLKSYGINGNLLSWLNSFLTGRLQQVTLNNVYSEWSNVVSGVPQGSVLGPILFLIYVTIFLQLWTAICYFSLTISSSITESSLKMILSNYRKI